MTTKDKGTRPPGREGTGNRPHRQGRTGVLRYTVTVATADTENGFMAAWTILDRTQGIYYSSSVTFDDASLPKVAAALVMATRYLRSYPPGSAIVMVPSCEETGCVNSLYNLWKESSDELYAHEDYNYWEEAFSNLGGSSRFVTYLSQDLPGVALCNRMLKARQ